MNRKGLLIVVSGPSGVGKGTICKELFARRDDLCMSISATTRVKRDGEEDGKNYFFVSVDEFQKMIKEDKLLEYAKVYENFYGTPKEFVMDKLEKGIDVILEIDIQGALQVKEEYPEGVFVFILPPSMDELMSRIVGRGSETEESLKLRLGSAFDEIKQIAKYDYFIVNKAVISATDKLENIIESERLKLRLEMIEQIVNKFKEDL
jgi:guanylate kinase